MPRQKKAKTKPQRAEIENAPPDVQHKMLVEMVNSFYKILITIKNNFIVAEKRDNSYGSAKCGAKRNQ